MQYVFDVDWLLTFMHENCESCAVVQISHGEYKISLSQNVNVIWCWLTIGIFKFIWILLWGMLLSFMSMACGTFDVNKALRHGILQLLWNLWKIFVWQPQAFSIDMDTKQANQTVIQIFRILQQSGIKE